MFKLKEFRNAHGLFQSQMAEILGTTQSSLSRMETEKIELTIAQYQKLYDKFGIEEVDAYKIETLSAYDIASPSKEIDSSLYMNELLNIIKRQNEIIVQHSKKQDELNEKLLTLLERFTTK